MNKAGTLGGLFDGPAGAFEVHEGDRVEFDGDARGDETPFEVRKRKFEGEIGAWARVDLRLE
jgi:hypothetical protein